MYIRIVQGSIPYDQDPDPNFYSDGFRSNNCFTGAFFLYETLFGFVSFFFTYSEPTNRTVSLVFFAYICPSIKCAKSLSLLEINKIHTVPVIYRFPL